MLGKFNGWDLGNSRETDYSLSDWPAATQGPQKNIPSHNGQPLHHSKPLVSMGRAKGDPELAKLKKQLRNDQYGSNNQAAQKKREKDKLYRQKKREQEHLQLHRDPLAQLADIVTQQDYLQDVVTTELPIVPEHTEEQESIDTGLIVEEEGEILEIFGRGVSEELNDSGFLDGMGFDEGFDEGFQDEGKLSNTTC